MAKYELEGISHELFKFLNEKDRKEGELDRVREANNDAASKELGRIYLASIDDNGFLKCDYFVNKHTGNTGIKLGRPIGRGGMNLVCEGKIEDFDDLDLYSFYINILKHDIRANNGGGNIDDLRIHYVAEAENLAEKIIKRGQFEKIRSETKSVLASKFKDGKCAVRISTSNTAPILSTMERSSALDGLVHPGTVYSGVRGYNDEGRVVQVIELVDNVVDPNQIHSRFSSYDIVDLLKQSLEVICLFKELGMVHRDIKPSNVLVVEGKKGPRAKIADLDLMKLTERNDDRSATITKEMIKASIPYASPEHLIDAENVNLAADICSLGLTTYNWLTGYEPLFYDPDWDNLKEKDRNHNIYNEVLERKHKPVRPSLVSTRSHFTETNWYNLFEKHKVKLLETEFEKIIAKMIVIERENRYQEPADVLLDIEKMLHGGRVDIGFNVNKVFGTSRKDIR